MVFVSFIPSCLCFSPPSHPFLQGLIYFNQVSIYSCEVSSLFSINVLIRWFPMKMLSSFKFIMLRSLFFSGGLISSFGVDHISSFCFTYLPMWISYPRLSYLFTLPSSYPECWRYLGRFMFPFSIRSSYFEVVTSFKTFKSTGALSLPKQSFNGVFLLSGP